MVASVSTAGTGFRFTLEERSAHAANSRREAIYDAALVRRFNAGDEPAFVEIVTRHRAKTFRIALGLLRNRADAEEVAQDTFVRAHRGLARFRGDSSLAVWLHRIALNLSRNRYWYFHRRQRHHTFPLEANVGPDNATTFANLIASAEAHPARDLVTREFGALVATCMEQLSDPQREILQLRNARQCSYVEIGRMLGISIGTVKSRIARARINLQGRLAEMQAAEFRLNRPIHLVHWFEPDRPPGWLARL